MSTSSGPETNEGILSYEEEPTSTTSLHSSSLADNVESSEELVSSTEPESSTVEESSNHEEKKRDRKREIVEEKKSRRDRDNNGEKRSRRNKEPVEGVSKRKKNRKESSESAIEIEDDSSDDRKDWPKFHPRDCCYPAKTYKKDCLQIKNEVLSGVSVAFAQVPESIGFAFLAGVPPQIGLHGAWMMGLIMSLFGARPGMINGATGATAAVYKDPIAALGIDTLFVIVMLSGTIELIFGLFGVSRLVRMIPMPVLIGFTNALAVIILSAQAHAFTIPHTNTTFPICPNIEATKLIIPALADNITDYSNSTESGFLYGEYVWGVDLIFMVGLIVLTITTVLVLPKFSKLIPGPLIALALGTVIEQIIRVSSNYCTPLVAETSLITGSFPGPFWIPYPNPKFLQPEVFLAAFISAAATIVEQLVTMEITAEITDTETIDPDQDIIVLGLANIICGFFGNMGGGAMIGLTMVNVHSGSNGRYRISGVIGAILVMLISIIATPLIEYIPLGVLVGIMLVVVFHTFNWTSVLFLVAALLPEKARDYIGLKLKVQRTDVIVILVVTFVTLIPGSNLFYSVILGVFLSCAFYAWDSSSRTTFEIQDTVNKDGKPMRIYHIDGPLFFSSTTNMIHFIKPHEDPKFVEIHLTNTSIYDFTAMDGLNRLGAKYKKLKKEFKVKRADLGSFKLVKKAGTLFQNFQYELHEEVLSSPESLHVDEDIFV